MAAAQAPEVDIRKVVANKQFTVKGVTYQPGDPVDVSGLPAHKIGQLLTQRYLRPMTATG